MSDEDLTKQLSLLMAGVRRTIVRHFRELAIEECARTLERAGERPEAVKLLRDLKEKNNG